MPFRIAAGPSPPALILNQFPPSPRSQGQVVNNVDLSTDGKFAFVEFRDEPICTLALTLFDKMEVLPHPHPHPHPHISPSPLTSHLSLLTPTLTHTLTHTHTLTLTLTLQVAEIPGLMERAGDDFNTAKSLTIASLSSREKMQQELEQYKGIKQFLTTQLDLDAERLAMGKWFADYLDDAGYESWVMMPQLYKAMLMNAFPPIDALDNKMYAYAQP